MIFYLSASYSPIKNEHFKKKIGGVSFNLINFSLWTTVKLFSQACKFPKVKNLKKLTTNLFISLEKRSEGVKNEKLY